jgi:hypothetical protein
VVGGRRKNPQVPVAAHLHAPNATEDLSYKIQGTAMPDMYPYIEWLQNSWLSNSIRDTLWFPAIETVHLFGIVILLSTMLAIDLRLMGLWLQRWPVSVLMERLLPWSWTAFGVMVLTGSGLFISDPMRFFYNNAFRVKMLLIVLAGLNALTFQFTAFRGISDWDVKTRTPIAAKIAGLVSLLVWFGVVAAGRWIGFVE